MAWDNNLAKLKKNKLDSLKKGYFPSLATYEVRSCEVAIIWPDGAGHIHPSWDGI